MVDRFEERGIKMAFYQYYCEENKKTVEVEHSMTRRLTTWGEVCFCAGIPLGSTAEETPVIRLISHPLVSKWRVQGLDKDMPSSKLEF